MAALIWKEKVAGIHSKQPWFVLSAELFYTCQLHDNPYISHFYSFRMGQDTDTTVAIPDGCVDLLFDCDGDKPAGLVCGSTLQAREVRFNIGHDYFGVRFIPGTVPEFLDVAAPDLIEHQSNFMDVAKGSQHICEQVSGAGTFLERVNIIRSFLSRQRTRSPSRLTAQIVEKICQEQGNIQVQELERYSGYCARTLQRQFMQDIGLTPKSFIRAIRCQSAVYNINHNELMTFSDLAAGLGFSDQAHFLREFKQLVNVTPSEYRHQVKQKGYLERLHCW